MPHLDPCQTLRDLLATMQRLRAPGGCAWDAQQTPTSLLPYLLEEACEAIEAIETGDPREIVDELGDLLLQIVFQAEIFAERGLFDFADVAAAIHAKLLRRHPHVFATGENPADLSSDGLTRQWEQIKQLERKAHAAVAPHPLGPLPGSLPALQRAQKLAHRARHRHVPLPTAAAFPITAPLTEAQLGEQLFALAHYAEAHAMDAERALRQHVQQLLGETRNALANDGTGPLQAE